MNPLLLTFIFVNVAVCLVQSAAIENCNIACPRIYYPVCGVDNTGNYKTFDNLCLLEVAQCENRGAEWRLIAEKQCEDIHPSLNDNSECPSACPLNFAPVCGMDNTGKTATFANKCVFESIQCNNRGADWKLTMEHACDSPPSPTVEEEDLSGDACPTVCTMEYVPVCGMDNTGNEKTFGNKCGFEVEQCNNRGADWRIIKHSECDGTNDNAIAPSCDKGCTREWRPVCGSDNTGNQRTFANKCVFEVAQCENRGAEWRLISNNDCRLRTVESNECSPACPFVLRPVCGMDNTGNMKTFDNECLFKYEQCQSRGAEWRLIAEHDCRLRLTDDQQCPTPCTLEYEPVCGADNTGNLKTFPNECAFKNTQCEHRGAEWRLIAEHDCRLRLTDDQQCPQVCTREYKPVCGADNTGNLKTFNNECEFKVTECENRGAEWRLVSKQDCRLRLPRAAEQQCPAICPLLLAPVCGVDNTGNRRTFDNECLFKKEQCDNRGAEWRIESHQDCRLRAASEETTCPKICTMEYNPVCGMDNTGNQRTFGSECVFRAAQCQNRGAEWRLIATQECRLRLTDDQQCPSVCPLIFAPVCGADNTGNRRTFDNECTFKKEQCENRGAEWRMVGEHECRFRRSAEDATCPQVCTREYKPVCGADNTGNLKTFNNECEFKVTECENRGAEWRLVSKQDCRLRLPRAAEQQCPAICPLLLAPVCGVDNTGNRRTFDNECLFKKEQCDNRGAEWRLVAKQDCRLRLPRAVEQQCPAICPLLLAPVCGVDNTGNRRTFDNECLFKKEQCDNRGAEWRLVAKQDCRLRLPQEAM